jgi:putative transcriptional regulator
MKTLIGNLLIAPPAVKGNFWYKTVVMITENHNDGTVGLVLNKRSQMSVKEFGEQLGFHIDLPGFVYLGGPVNVKSLSFLHSNEWVSKNTLPINQHYSLSSADDILPRLAMGDCPERWRLFLGMCGWAEGQLAGEIKGDAPWNKETSWCLATGDQELVFGTDNKDQWCNALDRSGLEFAQKILA